MGSYLVALFVTLALVLQLHQIVANDCKKRSTFIQIRIPQRTNVAIKYPKEINPVQFVPFPYNPKGSECIKCQESTCSKCTYTKKPHSVTMENVRKTNIIIDIKGTRQLNDSTSQSTSNINNNNSTSVDGTIVAIYDKTTALSTSGATAEAGKAGKSAAAVASGTALSQSDVLAAINDEVINKENGQKTSVEDIYVASEDLSSAKANSSAASEDNTKTDDSKPSTDEYANSKDTSNGGKTAATSPSSSDATTSPIGKASSEAQQSSVVKNSDTSTVTTTETVADKKETSVDTSTAAKTKIDN